MTLVLKETYYLCIKSQINVLNYYVYFFNTADFIKKGTFSVHSFIDDYLSIPERSGS